MAAADRWLSAPVNRRQLWQARPSPPPCPTSAQQLPVEENQQPQLSHSITRSTPPDRLPKHKLVTAVPTTINCLNTPPRPRCLEPGTLSRPSTRLALCLHPPR